jgi:hypothetical protein
MRQDRVLCQDIGTMRHFARLWDQMIRDKKSLSAADWKFLEWADEMQNED